jgi:hypothetical protein
MLSRGNAAGSAPGQPTQAAQPSQPSQAAQTAQPAQADPIKQGVDAVRKLLPF